MDEFWDEVLNAWWGKILMAIVLLGLAWLLFDAFASVERGEEVAGRVPW
jgi:hypothetical protein